ncbi:MAG: glycosyltransferase [Chloroflexota bacterium]
MEPVNILLLSLHYPYPLDHGGSIRTFNLLRFLAARHRVDLVTFADGRGDCVGLDILTELCRSVQVVPNEKPRHNRVRRAVTFLSNKPRSILLERSPAMARAVDSAVATGDHDVVLVEWLWLSQYAEAHHSIPRVLDDINAEAAMAERLLREQPNTGLSGIRQRLSLEKVRRYERQAVRRFDRTVVVSEVDRGKLISLGGDGEKISVVANGVDVAATAFQAYPVDPDHIVYPGSLTYQPNRDACLYFVEHVLPKIREQKPATRFSITGRLLAVTPDRLKYAQGVELLGYVDDVTPVVGSAAVCVVPLRQGGGTRLKILEAMALGTPVVSTSVGAEGLAVEDGKHLLLADDPDALALAVISLMDDGALRQRLALAGRALVEHSYSWEASGQRLEAVLSAASQPTGSSGKRSMTPVVDSRLKD